MGPDTILDLDSLYLIARLARADLYELPESATRSPLTRKFLALIEMKIDEFLEFYVINKATLKEENRQIM